MNNRPALAWAFYDWANSAFAVTVMAGFFPVFFKQYWASALPATESTFWLGMINGAAGLVLVLFAPLLGAMADAGGGHKRLLALFAFLGIVATALLPWVAAGQWPLAALFYVLAVLGFSGGNLFYDALLPRVAEQSELDRVSALGFALGYLGGGLLFALNTAMVSAPQWFGLGDAAAAVRLAFVLTSVWWLLFSIPLWLWVPAPVGQPVPLAESVVLALRRLSVTLHHIRSLPQTTLFLLAYWLYIDGVDTVVHMAVDFGLSLGFGQADLMQALLLTQFVGFPAALLFGQLGTRLGPKAGIGIAILAYLLIVGWAARMQTVTEFYGLAVAVGLVQGGIQALSRSLFVRFIPAGYEGEFFGFYNMLGKFAAVLGPVLMGVMAHWSGDSRLSILSVGALFLLGGLLLARLNVQVGGRQAAEFAPSVTPPCVASNP